eukprot:TRINITY_DN330_c0_g3_i1.p1 TRINITY_DN330_c0_g3~~TRINITY_DN330_c0_g3_i1.p1  ORF type:complete len:140 (-),score=8.84 TRINITY_DN330_c0_g3_i1:152-571(-)
MKIVCPNNAICCCDGTMICTAQDSANCPNGTIGIVASTSIQSVRCCTASVTSDALVHIFSCPGDGNDDTNMCYFQNGIGNGSPQCITTGSDDYPDWCKSFLFRFFFPIILFSFLFSLLSLLISFPLIILRLVSFSHPFF